MFRIGSQVQIKQDQQDDFTRAHLSADNTYTVSEMDGDGMLRLEGVEEWFFDYRFKKADVTATPPTPREFRVGDKVRVKNGNEYQRLIPNGSIHLVTKVSTTWDGKTGLGFVIDGNEREFYSRRFELVEEPVLDDSPIKVGDTVYLTDPSKTSQQWLDHEYIVQNVPYTVNYVGHNHISLDNSSLVHNAQAFSRRPSGKVAEPVKPVAMIPVQDVLDQIISIGDPKLLDPLDMSKKMSDLIDFLQAKL